MKKVILTILDGYGISSNSLGNATYLANTKTIDYLLKNYKTSYLEASGLKVGLPDNQMGNSEVGHMNIGAGRIIYQDLTRINKDIENKTFFSKEELINTILYAKNNKKKLHLLGLLSDGGVHSHINHLFAILDLCSSLDFRDVHVHVILDGRDTDSKGGIIYLEKLIDKLKELSFPNIATVIGRFYTMDRDNRFERIKIGYSLMTEGKGEISQNLLATIKEKYYNNVLDEFMSPIVVDKNGLITPYDALLFYNFRPDRAREITRAFIDKNFTEFERTYLNLYYTSMTLYDLEFTNHVIYKKEKIENTLGYLVSKNNLKQLRIAETEKYAHVTFFLNGGVETEYKGENRILIPSPKEVKTYDLKPEMSAYLVKDKVVEAINENYYDLIVLNFANPDMVGHTGNLEACILALEHLDKCLEEIYQVVLKNDYVMLLTADHGNCECMLNEDLTVNTAHTTNLVPFCVINYEVESLKNGKLADIAPTILDILDIEKPEEMTGNSLI